MFRLLAVVLLLFMTGCLEEMDDGDEGTDAPQVVVDTPPIAVEVETVDARLVFMNQDQLQEVQIWLGDPTIEDPVDCKINFGLSEAVQIAPGERLSYVVVDGEPAECQVTGVFSAPVVGPDGTTYPRAIVRLADE